MNRRNSNRLSIESLECREMMAADAAFACEVLPLAAVEMNDQVVVSPIDPTFQGGMMEIAIVNRLVEKSIAPSQLKTGSQPVDSAARDAAFGEIGSLGDFQSNTPKLGAIDLHKVEPKVGEIAAFSQYAGLSSASNSIQGLSGTDLGSGRIKGLSGTDLGSGRRW